MAMKMLRVVLVESLAQRFHRARDKGYASARGIEMRSPRIVSFIVPIGGGYSARLVAVRYRSRPLSNTRASRD